MTCPLFQKTKCLFILVINLRKWTQRIFGMTVLKKTSLSLFHTNTHLNVHTHTHHNCTQQRLQDKSGNHGLSSRTSCEISGKLFQLWKPQLLYQTQWGRDWCLTHRVAVVMIKWSRVGKVLCPMPAKNRTIINNKSQF